MEKINSYGFDFAIWKIIPSVKTPDMLICGRDNEMVLLTPEDGKKNVLQSDASLFPAVFDGRYLIRHLMIQEPYPQVIGSQVMDVSNGEVVMEERKEVTGYVDGSPVYDRGFFQGPFHSFRFPAFYEEETEPYRMVYQFLKEYEIKNRYGINYLDDGHKLFIGANVSDNDKLVVFLYVFSYEGDYLGEIWVDEVEKPVQDYFFLNDGLLYVFYGKQMDVYRV